MNLPKLIADVSHLAKGESRDILRDSRLVVVKGRSYTDTYHTDIRDVKLITDNETGETTILLEI